MSPSRRGDPGGSRSADERERDRRERERRRARRDGGDPGGDAGDPFDILATGVDPTISRPPDLDWPLERSEPGAALGASGAEWADPPVEPARRLPERHLVFDPVTGYQKFVSVDPAPAGGEGSIHGEGSPYDEPAGSVGHEHEGGHQADGVSDLRGDPAEPGESDGRHDHGRQAWDDGAAGYDPAGPPHQAVTGHGQGHDVRPPGDGTTGYGQGHDVGPPGDGMTGYGQGHDVGPPGDGMTGYGQGHDVGPPGDGMTGYGQGHDVGPPGDGMTGYGQGHDVGPPGDGMTGYGQGPDVGPPHEATTGYGHGPDVGPPGETGAGDHEHQSDAAAAAGYGSPVPYDGVGGHGGHPPQDPGPGYEPDPGYPSHPGDAEHPSYAELPGSGEHPSYAEHPGYGGPGDVDPLDGYAATEDPYADPGRPASARGRATGAGGPAGGRAGLRNLKGRLGSVSLPTGRPSLPGRASFPASVDGIGSRLSGLRGPRSGVGGPAKPALGRRLPADGEGGASRAGSLRRSLDPRTARRSTLSDGSSNRSTGTPRGRIAAAAALVGVLFALWFLISLFQPFTGGGHGQVEVVIPKGAGTSAIGSLLAKDHVISSSFFFKLRAQLSGKRGKLESGRYVLKQGMSYGAALAALTSSSGQPTATVKITIPEGLTRAQIAGLATKAGVVGDYFAASAHSHVLKPTSYGAKASVRSLEGFLFPDTYQLLPGDPVSKLINDQLVAFKAQFATVDLTAAKHLHLTAYDVITIASMVEREAQLPRERPLVAAVIYNRLKAGMQLGIDATIRYALNNFDKPLTQSQLASNSPYNTRLHRGLPPTPIGNPGLASLEAAAHPAKVAYLYYVVKPGTCGQDAFSSTFAQFQKDSQRYNNARNAANGRSPTTCGG